MPADLGCACDAQRLTVQRQRLLATSSIQRLTLQ
jgi:hypothetical protein